MRSRVCALLTLVVWLGGYATARGDLREIKRRGTLRVLVAADELPEMFSIVSSARPGLEREILESFAAVQGLRLEVKPVERFERMIPSLLEGEGDLIVGIIVTSARRELIDFTSETLPARHVIVTRRPALPIVHPEGLRSVRVGVLTGTSWADVAAEVGVPEHNTAEFGLTPAMLAALREGVVSATIMSVTDFALQKSVDDDLEAGGFVGPAGSAAWGVRKADVGLRDSLSRHITSLKRTPSWGRMVLRYFNRSTLTLIARARR